MKIIDPNSSSVPGERSRYIPLRNLYLGALLILVGGVWLLRNFGVINNGFFQAVFSWQMFLIAVGGYLITTRNYYWGSTSVAMGAILMVVDFCDLWIPADKLLFPLLVIFAGISFLFHKS